MGALTKAEIINHLFEEIGLNKREGKEIVECFFEEIASSLENNVPVKLSGFGNFELRDKKSGPVEIQRLAKRFRSRRGESLLSTPVKS